MTISLRPIVLAMFMVSLLTEVSPAMAAVKSLDRPGRGKPIIAGVDELIRQGLAYNAAGRYEEAWAVFREAATLAPENPFVLYNLGTVLGMLRRYREASLYLLEAVRLSPDMLPAWINLGGMYNQLAMPKEALAAFHQVLRLNPNDTNARYQSGVNLVRLGRLAEASIEEEELRAINPDLADELLQQILAAEK